MRLGDHAYNECIYFECIYLESLYLECIYVNKKGNVQCLISKMQPVKHSRVNSINFDYDLSVVNRKT